MIQDFCFVFCQLYYQTAIKNQVGLIPKAAAVILSLA